MSLCHELIIIVMLVTGLQLHAVMSDREIAQESIAHSAKLLNTNGSDALGKRLLKVAQCLDAEGDDVLLVSAYLSRGKTPPVMQTSGSLDDLMRAMKARGIYLLKNHFSRNDRVGKLALVYFHTADQHIKSDATIIKALAYLKSYGFDSELDSLLTQQMDLDEIYKGRKAPRKLRGPEISKADSSLAAALIAHGSSLLAMNRSSALGTRLVQVGLHLEPGNVAGLQVEEELKRSMPIPKAKSDPGKDRLVESLVDCAAHHYKLISTSPLSAHLSLLCLRTAEGLVDTDRKVILGLAKLKSKGHSSSLDQLLAIDAATIPSRSQRQAIAAASPSRPGLQFRNYTTPTLGSSSSTPSSGDLDPRKLEFKLWAGRKDRKAAHGDFDDMMQHLDVRITVENWMKGDVDNYKMKIILIGRDVVHKRRYGIVGILDEKLSIKQKREQKIERSIYVPYDDTNTVRYGHKYYGYIMFVYKADGTEFKRHASTSGLRKKMDKIKKLKKGKSFGL